jgi:hypothetical protein
MKFLAKVTLSTEAGNALCRDKDMHRKMDAIMSDVRPESVYFGADSGNRTMFCIVNVDNGHDLPRVAEPFWLGLNATVDFTPVLTAEEFKKAGTVIESAVKKYNW